MPLVETGPVGDLGQEHALSLQDQDLAVGGEHCSSIRLHSYCPARSGWGAVPAHGVFVRRGLGECSLLLDRGMKAAATVDEPVAGHFHQKGAKWDRSVNRHPHRGNPPAHQPRPIERCRGSRAWYATARSAGAARPSEGKARKPGRLAPRPKYRPCSAADQLIQRISAHDSLEVPLPGSWEIPSGPPRSNDPRLGSRSGPTIAATASRPAPGPGSRWQRREKTGRSSPDDADQVPHSRLPNC